MKRKRASLIPTNQTALNPDDILKHYFSGVKKAVKIGATQKHLYLLYLIYMASTGITATELNQYRQGNNNDLLKDLENMVIAGYITRNDQKQYRVTDEGRYLLRTCLPSFGIE